MSSSLLLMLGLLGASCYLIALFHLASQARVYGALAAVAIVQALYRWWLGRTPKESSRGAPEETRNARAGPEASPGQVEPRSGDLTEGEIQTSRDPQPTRDESSTGSEELKSE
jgi:hypothetical protein